MLRYDFLLGSEAALFVPVVWGQIPERIKNYVLWNLPKEQRESQFYSQIAESALVTYVWQGEKLIACAWLQEINKTAVWSHFFFTERPIDQVSERYWAIVSSLDRWEWALALIPVVFRHVRNYAAKCGFTLFERLQEPVYIYGKGEKNAVIMKKNLREK